MPVTSNFVHHLEVTRPPQATEPPSGPDLCIGFNARLFPQNWRPLRDEIAFAEAHGFKALQLRGDNNGLDEAKLGDAFPAVLSALQAAQLTVTLELVIRIDEEGLTVAGKTPLDVLKVNLSAITALCCQYVHWHLVLLENPLRAKTYAWPSTSVQALEHALVPQFFEAVALAQAYGFQMGFEHNDPALKLFARPECCAALLDAVPGLKFVWDVNHTLPAYWEGFRDLLPRTSMLHIADTPLPTVNYHLPLGLGTIDWNALGRTLLESEFRGPAILEIGGLPKSGGYGRDTDEALIDSLRRLREALGKC